MISLLLFAIAALLNAAMDMNFNMFDRSIFSTFKNQTFWNPYRSWINKWKGHDASKGPRFFGSTTFLVFLTDSWHLIKSLFILALIGSVITFDKNIFDTFSPLIVLPIYSIVWGLVFEAGLKLFKKDTFNF
jgi:hypothetical protein